MGYAVFVPRLSWIIMRDAYSVRVLVQAKHHATTRYTHTQTHTHTNVERVAPLQENKKTYPLIQVTSLNPSVFFVCFSSALLTYKYICIRKSRGCGVRGRRVQTWRARERRLASEWFGYLTYLRHDLSCIWLFTARSFVYWSKVQDKPYLILWWVF